MALEAETINQFDERVRAETGDDLHCVDVSTVQVNIGLKCNLQCVHCHVASSPWRKEMMSWENLEHVIDVAKRIRCKLVDITGGAPELHPDLRRFIQILHEAAIPVMVRTNLTVLLEPGMETLAEFFRDHRVQLPE